MSDLTYCANGCTRNDNGTRNPTITEPPSLICPHCENNLTKWLREIPERYNLLPAFLANGSTPSDPDAKIPRRTEAPAPMRLGIIDDLDTRRGRKWLGLAPTEDRRGTVGTLHAHAQRLRQEHRLKPLTKPPTVTGEAALLSRHLLWLAEQDWINDLYDEIRTLHRHLGDAIGEHRPRPVGTCIVDTEGKPCGGPLLPSTAGGVHCPRCGDTWNTDELRRLGLLLGEGA